jgi:hypothetical protein
VPDRVEIIEPCLHELVNRVRSGRRLVLLAGAGISAGAVRTGQQLTRLFNEQLRKSGEYYQRIGERSATLRLSNKRFLDLKIAVLSSKQSV